MSVEQKAIRHMQRAQELLGAGELGFGARGKLATKEDVVKEVRACKKAYGNARKHWKIHRSQ